MGHALGWLWGACHSYLSAVIQKAPHIYLYKVIAVYLIRGTREIHTKKAAYENGDLLLDCWLVDDQSRWGFVHPESKGKERNLDSIDHPKSWCLCTSFLNTHTPLKSNLGFKWIPKLTHLMRIMIYSYDCNSTTSH